MPPIENIEALSIPDDPVDGSSSPDPEDGRDSSQSSTSSRRSISPQPDSALFRMFQEHSLNIRVPSLHSILFREIRTHQGLSTPREQSLLDLLRHNGEESSTLKEVKLKVIAATISLSRIGLYCPMLRILKLDGSVLSSLRDIGTGLRHLKILHVSKCGLSSLDGTYGLTSLTELYAGNNSISHLGPCTALQHIKVLHLERNKVSSIGAVSFLAICPKLVELNLAGNPIASTVEEYQDVVTDMLPNLRMYDGKTLFRDRQDVLSTAEDNNMKSETDSLSCSIDVSSLTEPNSIDSFTSLNLSEKDPGYVKPTYITRRPATSSGIGYRRKNCVDVIQRPSTGCSARINLNKKPLVERPHIDEANDNAPSILTSGTIVCGNIGRALSRSKRGRGAVNSLDADFTSDLPFYNASKNTEFLFCPSSKTNSKKNIDSRHPRHTEVNKLLEQEPPEKPKETTPVVELELGVTGIVSEDEGGGSSGCTSHSEALEASKMWRKAFKLYRKQRKY